MILDYPRDYDEDAAAAATAAAADAAAVAADAAPLVRSFALFARRATMADRSNSTANITQACVNLNDYLWEDFRELSTRYSTMAIFASLYATIIACGVFGNLCVILAVAKNKQLQTVPNW